MRALKLPQFRYNLIKRLRVLPPSLPLRGRLAIFQRVVYYGRSIWKFPRIVNLSVSSGIGDLVCSFNRLLCASLISLSLQSRKCVTLLHLLLARGLAVAYRYIFLATM